MNIKLEHIVIGVLILAVMGVITLPGLQQPAAIPGVPVTPGVVVTCDSTVTPDIDINAFDQDNPTTEFTDAKNLYRKVPNGAWTTWTLGTEITNLEFGSTYEFFIPGDTTTSNIKNKTYGKYITWTAPCREDDTMKIYVANNEEYDGLTVTDFDADGTASTAEVFTAGQIQTISAKWVAGADQNYGHPFLESYPMLSDNGNHRRKYPNILCLKLNSSSWEIPIEVYLDDGTAMRRVSNPTISAADGATTHIMYCYEAPVITDRIVEIFMTLEADGTVTPYVDDTAYLYCGNIYIDSDTGEPAWGVEDNKAAYTCGNGDADELTLNFV